MLGDLDLRRLQMIQQAPHPLHKSAERATDGFSLEKFAKVPHGHV
jgi:hypothetical protein